MMLHFFAFSFCTPLLLIKLLGYTYLLSSYCLNVTPTIEVQLYDEGYMSTRVDETNIRLSIPL